MTDANLDSVTQVFVRSETPEIKNGVQLWLPDWLLASLAALATFFVFLPALQNGFVNWDDRLNFIDNPHYRGLGWDQLRWMFTTFHQGHYQPLSWLTLGADYLFSGMNPYGYHLTSLILHAVNTALFYLLALRLLSLAGASSASLHPAANRIGAMVAALFFAVHPLRVESVAWVTERRDVLSGFFLLSAALLYLHAVSTPKKARWWVATLVVYLFSLLSKASGLTFPFVLLVLDIYPLRRLGWGSGRWFGRDVRSIWFEKIPFIFLGCIAAVIALLAQKHTDAALSFEEYTITSRLVQSLFGLLFYIIKTIAPFRLSPLYQLQGNSTFWSLGSLLLLLIVSSITIGLFLLRRRWPAGLACWVCYVAFLAPVLGVAQSGLQLVADRYSYLSCLGWAILLGGGFSSIWIHRPEHRFAPSGVFVATGLAVFIVGGLGFLTRRQVAIWHDSERLWRHAISVSASGMAHLQLGNVLRQQSKFQEAIQEYQKALQFNWHTAVVHNNLGALFHQQGKPQEAIQHLKQALAFAPDNVDANFNLALISYREGRLEEATQFFRRTLASDPNHAAANYHLANIFARRKQVPEAIKYYQEAIRLEPAHAEARSNLGSLYMDQGELYKATQEFVTALKINPNLVRTRFNLGLLFVSQKNLPGARKEFEQILRIDPDFAESHYYLGAVLIAQKEIDRGVEELRAAVKLRPDFSDAHLSLARALVLRGERDEAVKHYEEALRISKSQRQTNPAP